MPHLTTPISGQEVFSTSTTQVHALGECGMTQDGRKFRYCRAGATDLVVGNCLQAAAQDADHDNLTAAAAAIDATTVTLTLGTSSVTANQYAEGWLVIDTTPGLGYAYKISSHPQADASATVALTLYRQDAVRIALTTASRGTLMPNPYDNVIQAPTTLTSVPVGGCVHIIGDTEFGWIQTGGPGAALIQATPAVGNALSPSGTTAGALAINSGTLPIVANIQVTGVNGRVMPVFWLID